MLVHLSNFISILSTSGISGLSLSSDTIELIYNITADLGYTCITVIVENIDGMEEREKQKLVEKLLPILLLKSDDLEELLKLVNKDKYECLYFTFLADIMLQAFLNSMTGPYSEILDEPWFLMFDKDHFEMDPQLVRFTSNVNLVLKSNLFRSYGKMSGVDIDKYSFNFLFI